MATRESLSHARARSAAVGDAHAASGDIATSAISGMGLVFSYPSHRIACRGGTGMKPPHRRQFLHLAAGVTALPPESRITRAQAYPWRPIMMVVPFPAGGPLDTIARIAAEAMRAPLGQPVIVEENVSGAAGTLGVGHVARAAAGGYTIDAGFVGTPR